jgi:hypothetical protein
VIAGLIRDLRRADGTTRAAALQDLEWIGPPAREAIPDLLAMLEDEDRGLARAAAAAAHWKIDPAEVPVYLRPRVRA